MNIDKLKQLAQEAYIYFYPFVSMEMTRLQFMYTDPKVAPGAGPMNTIGHFRSFPTADIKTVVRVNFDTLYSTSWIDLTDGPIVLSVGENNDQRYYELPLYDMWTDAFAIPGSRVNGFEAKDFLLIPNNWSGNVPENVTPIFAPTNYIWLIGRTQANGNNDTSVHQFQDAITLTPLNNWLSKQPTILKKLPKRDDINITTPVALLVHNMQAAEFYNLAMSALIHNPPHDTDWSFFYQLQQIGIRAGHTFEQLSPEVQQELQNAIPEALQLIEKTSAHIGNKVNGWQIYNEMIGVYGNEYMQRAVITFVGLGANPPEEALYPFSTGDQNGDALLAEHNYTIHFEKEQLPPVKAFWSFTLYDREGYQVANEIDRFAIGDRDDLHFEADGSLTLYIQKNRPEGAFAKNWLPAPQSGEFNLTLRLYSPSREILTLEWVPPVITKTT